MFAGLAITELPVLALSVLNGDHAYVEALLAVNIALVPEHMLADETAITGFGMAPTVKVAILVQLPIVPITEPVPAINGGRAVNVIDEPAVVFVVTPLIPTHV